MRVGINLSPEITEELAPGHETVASWLRANKPNDAGATSEVGQRATDYCCKNLIQFGKLAVTNKVYKSVNTYPTHVIATAYADYAGHKAEMENEKEPVRGNRHMHADVINAWANGAQIQCRASSDEPWAHAGKTPSWSKHLEFRVKPPVVNREKWVVIYRDHDEIGDEIRGYFLADTQEEASAKFMDIKPSYRVAISPFKWSEEAQ